jgi:hypothetical protein
VYKIVYIDKVENIIIKRVTSCKLSKLIDSASSGIITILEITQMY